ncbi:ankyrin repeat domain-containing protein [Streptomyces millisiae]|uniref:Ankyrin repeat domain-containing protein n=1 Tax=Streptomyces millisiae TaxID=3075542 RepID=A0ABU2LWI4_9ACTN|nr:ankyrin repeat domain-containing protein [Streptomyces sp. DSM 44918]MDT0321633.1 ankyrin repeat domain-containing protein [Streptomyces sp. DSM 44918]
MGFFDDLVLPEEPATERAVLARLAVAGEDEGRYAPPVDRFAPASVSQLDVVGAGAESRVVLTGWSLWPRSLTLHLAVFRKALREGSDPRRQSGLRVGLRFSDGRRVTSLDGTITRHVTVTGPRGPSVAATPQAIGLIPLDPGPQHSRRSLFKTDVDLYLAELPPPGETQLVVEWPDEGIAETHTPVDGAALRAAARRSIEVWPDLEPLEATPRAGLLATLTLGGPPTLLAPPLTRAQREWLRREEEARQRYLPRADWERVRYRDWSDTALIRARLDAGAPPGAGIGHLGATTPLHRAAEWGSQEGVRLLLAHGAAVDARDAHGHTPLWYAACSLDEGRVRALLDAGADAWTPQSDVWSPGRLLATTALAPLVTHLPGARELPAEDVAALRRADALIAAFGTEPLWTDGLGVAFVRGLSEDELIRRLGADPDRCPMVDPEDAPFDPMDYDESLRYVAVRAVTGAPGGCVVRQEGYLPSRDAVLEAISTGTSAYGVYFNPKGGRFGTLARDGESVARDEIGGGPHRSDPSAYWHFRFWQPQGAGQGTFPYGADILAYACAAAGLSIDDGRHAVDRRAPARWVELPPELRRR